MSNPNPSPATRFKKGDPRINSKGRPRSFDALRALTQSISNEVATVDGKPVIINEHLATNAEMIMRNMMHDNPERFVEIGYGKVPQAVEANVNLNGEIETKVIDDTRFDRAISSLADALRKSVPGEGDRKDG
jgi:hypothetical protein